MFGRMVKGKLTARLAELAEALWAVRGLRLSLWLPWAGPKLTGADLQTITLPTPLRPRPRPLLSISLPTSLCSIRAESTTDPASDGRRLRM